DRVFTPALNRFEFGGQAIGTPSVRVGFADDVYLALLALPGQEQTVTDGTDAAGDGPGADPDGADDGDAAASGDLPPDAILLRVIVEPLVVWLWIGGGVMAFGTLLAAWPGRRRRPTDPVSAPLDLTAADDGAAGDTGEGGGPADREPAEVRT